jgi:hypothetical protein
MGLPGTSVLAAVATYAGLQVRGTLKEFRARLSPWEKAAAFDQEAALDAASLTLVPRILNGDTCEDVATETLGLAKRVMARLEEAPSASGTRSADLRDDELLGHDEAAAMILGLQDRATRDRAAGWMEGAEAASALRLWRALARRRVGSYREHSAAPLTRAGWVAWSTGDELEAREVLAVALGADPDYLFARLRHQACNGGLDPEAVRRCLRSERAGRGGKEKTAVPAPDATDVRPRGSAQAAPSAEPPRPTATSGRHRKAPPARGGGRSIRRSLRTGDARHRRHADTPTGGDGPRGVSDGAGGRPRAHRVWGRCAGGRRTFRPTAVRSASRSKA